MNYLIDTNIILELVKPKPNAQVVTFISTLPPTDIYISTLIWGELYKGIETLMPSKKKTQLYSWLNNDLAAWFKNQILVVDVAVAERWAHLLIAAKRSLPVVDSLIAATALQHNAILLTRNKKDFKYPELRVINPFEETHLI
ncbi:MAG: type II toxin-antitoxin system VapC family toxin [Pseudomonadota bacterium]